MFRCCLAFYFLLIAFPFSFAQAQINSEVQYTIPSSGLYCFEAEVASEKGPVIEIVSDSNASRGVSVVSPRNERIRDGWVDYQVNIQTNDEWTVWVRAHGIEGDKGSDSVYASFDGGDERSIHTGRGSYNWRYEPDEFVLNSGEHRLRIRAREDGVRWDLVCLASSNSSDPSGLNVNILAPDNTENDSEDDSSSGGVGVPNGAVLVQEKTFIEAENANEVLGAFESASSSDASNNTYMMTPRSIGADYSGDGEPYAELVFSLFADSSDTYSIWLRTQGTDTSHDSFWVQVDNGDLISRSTGTGGWRWQEVSGPFVLSSGEHSLKIKLRESGSMIDKLVLTRNGDYNPNEDPSANEDQDVVVLVDEDPPTVVEEDPNDSGSSDTNTDSGANSPDNPLSSPSISVVFSDNFDNSQISYDTYDKAYPDNWRQGRACWPRRSFNFSPSPNNPEDQVLDVWLSSRRSSECRSFFQNPRAEVSDPMVNDDTFRFEKGGKYWFTFEVFIPKDWQPNGANTIISQSHYGSWRGHDRDGDSVTFDLGPGPKIQINQEPGDGRDHWEVEFAVKSADCSYSGCKKKTEFRESWDSGPVEKGQWTRWTIYWYMTEHDSGVFRVWKNRTRVANHEGRTSHDDINRGDVRIGVYSARWNEDHPVDEHHAFFNNIFIGVESGTGGVLP